MGFFCERGIFEGLSFYGLCPGVYLVIYDCSYQSICGLADQSACWNTNICHFCISVGQLCNKLGNK